MRTRLPPPLGLAPEALSLVASRFRALGDPSRLRILSHLLTGELSVEELVDATGLTQTATSRQLAVLRAERIVERRAVGRNAIYRVVDTTIADLCRIVCGGLERRLTDDLRVMGHSTQRPAARGVDTAGRRGS
jgi:ArsR family transcriptional regulator